MTEAPYLTYPVAQTREEWLKSRMLGVGGSDVAAILGLSKWSTPLAIYQDKRGESERGPETAAQHFGTALEDVVAKEFAARTGMPVYISNVFFVSKERPWEIANIDRIIGGEHDDSPVDCFLECKTARDSREWGPSQEEEIKAGEVLSDHEIPVYYETQVQWYMGVLGVKRCYLAVLIAGSDFRIYQIDRDDDVIAAMRDRVEEFWKERVLKGTPPDPVSQEDVKALWSSDDGEMVEASNEAAAVIGELKTVQAQIKDLEEQEKALKTRLVLEIGAHQGITIGGKKAATYKTQTTKRFSSTAFKEADPETYAAYIRPTTTRVLRVA